MSGDKEKIPPVESKQDAGDHQKPKTSPKTASEAVADAPRATEDGAGKTFGQLTERPARYMLFTADTVSILVIYPCFLRITKGVTPDDFRH